MPEVRGIAREVSRQFHGFNVGEPFILTFLQAFTNLCNTLLLRPLISQSGDYIHVAENEADRSYNLAGLQYLQETSTKHTGLASGHDVTRGPHMFFSLFFFCLSLSWD